MQEKLDSIQGVNDGSLVSLSPQPPSVMITQGSLLDHSQLHDEEDTTINSDHNNDMDEEEEGKISRRKETHVVPDSEEQARSLAASLADLQHTLQEEHRGILYVSRMCHVGFYGKI